MVIFLQMESNPAQNAHASWWETQRRSPSRIWFSFKSPRAAEGRVHRSIAHLPGSPSSIASLLSFPTFLHVPPGQWSRLSSPRCSSVSGGVWWPPIKTEEICVWSPSQACLGPRDTPCTSPVGAGRQAKKQAPDSTRGLSDGSRSYDGVSQHVVLTFGV